MNAEPHDIAAIESLLAFWRDAGVDACFEDAAVDRTIVVAPALKAVAKATASVVAPVDTRDVIAEARALARAADSVEALAEAVAAFRGCDLVGLGARGCVFGRGNATGSLLVIGDAPTAEDETAGQPFSGRVGALTDRMLAAAGVTEQAYLTNTVFWRPPGDRAPTPDEQATCAPFLERLLELLQPRAVLLLGASAARGVLRAEENIIKSRGQWREWRLGEGDVAAPTLATFHPAFLMKQPQAKRQAWADLLALAERVEETVAQSP